MNIFNLNDVVVEKIIDAKKMYQPLGYNRYDSEFRGGSPNAKNGFYSLIFSIEGESEFIFDHTSFCAKKNDIVYLDNHTPFRQISKNNYLMYSINFTATDGFINCPCIEYVSKSEMYLSLFREAAIAFEQRKPGYILLTKSILFKILAAIKSDNMKIHRPPVSKMDKVVFATDYINCNIANPQLSVEQIASELNISSAYLRRIFTEITELSPLKYIKNTRINHACSILNTEDVSVKETALRSGFYDVSYFCREFKKLVGTTPYLYKTKHRTIVSRYNLSDTHNKNEL